MEVDITLSLLATRLRIQKVYRRSRDQRRVSSGGYYQDGQKQPHASTISLLAVDSSHVPQNLFTFLFNPIPFCLRRNYFLARVESTNITSNQPINFILGVRFLLLRGQLGLDRAMPRPRWYRIYPHAPSSNTFFRPTSFRYLVAVPP